MESGTPRQRAHAQTVADITRIGREHLAIHGAAALSLRAVARDLGVVSSAVYRYVKSRDELLTLLIVDAYNELGDEVDHALEEARERSAADRFLVIAHAVRRWALAEPARYGLIYGGPVPGYAAPGEQTTQPGTRVIMSLLHTVEDMVGTGGRTRGPDRIPRALRGDFKRIRESTGVALPDGLLAAAILAWTALFGAVSFEVFGQFGADTFTDPALIFDLQMRQLVAMMSDEHRATYLLGVRARR